MTREEFDTWLANAKPGESIEYFVGFLPDATKHAHIPSAGAALAAYWEGKVELCQRRIGTLPKDGYAGRFQYLAQKRALVVLPKRDHLEAAA